jgi:hypothetical protein
MKPRNKKDTNLSCKSTKLIVEKEPKELTIIKPSIFNYAGKDIWIKLIK